MDPLPALGEVYSRVVMEEQKLTSAKNREQQHEAVGFTTCGDKGNLASRRVAKVAMYLGRADITTNKSENSILKNTDQSPTCSHYGQVGCDKRECLHVIGFPDWWTERGRSKDGEIQAPVVAWRSRYWW